MDEAGNTRTSTPDTSCSPPAAGARPERPADDGRERRRQGVVSVLAYLLMVAGLVGLLYTGALFARTVLGALVQLAAICLMVWARLVFGRRSFHLAAAPTEGGLVTSGPYRVIRHPIYAAVCLFVLAAVLAHLSARAGVLGGAVFAGAFLRMRAEERLLLQRYREYRQYAATTRRMVPYLF
jgi:protein-S-isoprenylcysteine O-methyltransferase Ste14